jgi:uncharacterized membrane protein YagU involved in acid resistance
VLLTGSRAALLSRRYDVKTVIIRGVLAGLVGTVVMTGAMSLIKKTKMAPGELAPKEIAENLEEKLDVRGYLPKPAFVASWTILHFGYGASSGLAYALAQEKVPDLNRPGLIGPLFGLLLWALGYCGWLPMFGLYPPLTRLPKRKVLAELITTHLIYGTMTALTHQTLRAKSEGG